MNKLQLSEAERKIMSAIHGTRKLGIPATASLRKQAEDLMTRGLVREDDDGLFVPDEVLMGLLASGQPPL